MVQGKSKFSTKASSSSSRQVRKDLKKGARVIPPKKTAAVHSAKLKRNLSAKITNSIEKQIVAAASGGKLSIMKPAPDANDKR